MKPFDICKDCKHLFNVDYIDNDEHDLYYRCLIYPNIFMDIGFWTNGKGEIVNCSHYKHKQEGT